MLIREASAADWPGIWPFLRRIVAAGETYTWPRDIDESTGRRRWLPGPPARVVVAVDDTGTVLGTAKLAPNQLGPGDHVANASFMVSPAAAGRGVGRALGAHVLDLARAEGYRAMQFNAVVASNERAVALWRSLGFTVVGRIPEGFRHPSQGYVDLLVMHRGL
ncbi:GNAT family N-acetyltransferase [Micromonospora sp. NBC_01655]|uniref:GNAT family N-acetyltransferase n=1 Tax=Micromonospora sp. NBC_01655 TaxID=2975983 RepID=UPI002254F939|nr:GNAT family N-acetyltransferase [Micromonospora sp. NBC_01655]MCX4471284.1 GNAT family N-acetyltransferase [Micromonospora sp. NBC_01655]